MDNTKKPPEHPKEQPSNDTKRPDMDTPPPNAQNASPQQPCYPPGCPPPPGGYPPPPPGYPPYGYPGYPPYYDAPNTGYTVLCAFFPIVGLILYLVWKDQFPLRARSAGKGAIIGLCISVGFFFLIPLLVMALVFSLTSFTSLD